MHNVVFVLIILLFNGCGDTDESGNVNATVNNTEVYSDNDFTITDWSDATHTKNVDPDFDEVFDDTQVKRLDIVVSSTRWQSMLDNMADTYGEFGVKTTNGSVDVAPVDGQMPEGTPPLEGAPVVGQMPEGTPPLEGAPVDNETTFLDEDPIFVPADVYYNNKQWYKVGIRFKGNSSLKNSWESGILKLSFKLDFDEYEDEYPQIDNQRFYGFKKFSLKNNYNDSSFIREKVASDVFKDAGLVVSHTAFYTLYIDHGEGPEYFGLYTLVEEVDGSVLDTQFTSDDGNLYKPENGSANFAKNSFNQEDFTKKTNEDDEDWSDIEALFTALHDTTRTTDPTTWRTNLESIFDVDSFLKYLAVNGVIQNWDTYGRMTHNYYLYNNPKNGKLTWIPWDNNEALKEGNMGGALDLDFADLQANNWPLIENIYADATYKAQYDVYLQNTIEGAFKVAEMETKYDTYSSLIQQYATSERDGFTFLNSTNDFDTAMEELKTHVNNRAIAVDNYLKQ